MTKVKFKIATIFLLTVLSESASATSITRHVECICSIIQLVANPEKYNGQMVTAKGVIGFEWKVPMIYLTAEHARLGINENAIRLGAELLPEETYQRLTKFEGKYVEVYGEFKNSAFAVVSGVDLASVKK